MHDTFELYDTNKLNLYNQQYDTNDISFWKPTMIFLLWGPKVVA